MVHCCKPYLNKGPCSKVLKKIYGQIKGALKSLNVNNEGKICTTCYFLVLKHMKSTELESSPQPSTSIINTTTAETSPSAVISDAPSNTDTESESESRLRNKAIVSKS